MTTASPTQSAASIPTTGEAPMRDRVGQPVSEHTIDGGYSGQITLIRGRSSYPDNPDLIFVKSELVGSLYLSLEQAENLAKALAKAVQA